ncbi:MAG TPA: hypothetical protein VF929_08875 [Gemmatimonadaceae bacterium]
MHDPRNHNDQSTDGGVSRVRSFVDEDGQRWRVYERVFDEYDRRSGTSLIFASETAVRRVRNYPENWTDLSDEELAAISWRS